MGYYDEICPSNPGEAYRRGERDHDRGVSSFRNPYEHGRYGEYDCQRAYEEWNRGHRDQERREEERRLEEQRAEQRAHERRQEEHRLLEAQWEYEREREEQEYEQEPEWEPVLLMGEGP